MNQYPWVFEQTEIGCLALLQPRRVPYKSIVDYAVAVSPAMNERYTTCAYYQYLGDIGEFIGSESANSLNSNYLRFLWVALSLAR
ncbi:hypothetical protein KXD40_000869 [Peronospora effusa]|uniref:Uncharacterized protein n=1 Tax=Peronospora effusa TaxID=542832 RepID=A0A3M6VEG3_9STRA|nr:hypothetical protein DD238_008345 [Peronospora effusa]RQM11981.1 hypothetical protein DD237_008230 [Peronospora effusa]UIZ21386.1 hypothetical protein KXD40_000869 [Peronospora effusa]